MNKHLIDIANSRLVSQQIGATNLKITQDVVGWMGAMQAQDYTMAKWAIGVRLPGATEETVEAAFNDGQILRTHLLRPTWHFVAAVDLYWMLHLTAPQIKVLLKSRHEQLGLSPAVLAKSNRILENGLVGGKHLTREEITAEFHHAHIATDENRLSHLLMVAELEGIVCSGAIKNGKQTYALLEERVTKTPPLNVEEASGKLAARYFTSHGPATLQDFVWWSGLSIRQAKQALEMVKPQLTAETIQSQTYWFTHLPATPQADPEAVHLLPAYDEFLISYKDRSATITLENHKKTVSNNGIFRPVLVVNGQVAGIWQRTSKKENVVLQITPFRPLSEGVKNNIEAAAGQYGRFLNKPIKISYHPSETAVTP